MIRKLAVVGLGMVLMAMTMAACGGDDDTVKGEDAWQVVVLGPSGHKQGAVQIIDVGEAEVSPVDGQAGNPLPCLGGGQECDPTGLAQAQGDRGQPEHPGPGRGGAGRNRRGAA